MPKFAVSLLIALAATAPSTLHAQQNPQGLALPKTAAVKDRLSPCAPGEVQLRDGFLGVRIARNESVRLRTVDEDDMLDAFERRTVPHQDWQGEHVGKFLHAASLAWANTGDPALKEKLDRVVARLLKTQESDGYLGTYVPEHRWTSWDVWVHKYDLLGLLTYYQYTHDLPETDPAHALSLSALAACRKIGDLLINTFGTEPGKRNINRAGEHMGMAADSVLEPVVLLYRATGDPRYLEFGRYIVSNYSAPGGPAILASLEAYGSVRRVANAKAYEMTSNFNGLLELYRATADKRLLNDMETAWNDIAHNRLYLTGSASSFEVFQDDFHLPNGSRSNICETCVTVTWEQMCLQMLRLTGEPKYAEEIERLAYNHLLGAQKPSGDDWAYYTPLDGRKPYDAATTCCHSSGPRGVALLPEVAAMTGDDGGVAINLYNSGTLTPTLRGGHVSIEVHTGYPLDGAVNLTINPEKSGMRFPLRLRIPAWCAEATVQVNGRREKATCVAGAYTTLSRRWAAGDRVTLSMKLPTSLVLGDHENDGKAAVLYGPLVLALDGALNPQIKNLGAAELATDDAAQLRLTPAPEKAVAGEPVFVVDGRVGAGGAAAALYLTPFAWAGQDGRSRFEVWIARHGKAAASSLASLLEGARAGYSRRGNQGGEINDGDPGSFRVTFDGKRADEDWYALEQDEPVEINRVVFLHGHSFHDGGWFDSSAGKPRVQVKTAREGEWKTVGVLDGYPAATATGDSGLQDGQQFELRFPAMRVVAVRVVGKPATGDNPEQAFSSCAELQAFFDKPAP